MEHGVIDVTRLLRKLNAPNVTPAERERLEAEVQRIMGQEFDSFETGDDLEDVDCSVQF